MGVWYITRETVQNSLDIKTSSAESAKIDRAIEAASRTVEGILHRRFYPEDTTRYFDWPNAQYAYTWRLWLEEHEVISVSALSSGGSAITAGQYFLEPVNDGPPFESIEINLDGTASFGQGNQGTHQRKLSVTGTFGYWNTTASVSSLEGAINSSVTTLAVTDGSAIGVGALLVIGTERVIVTAKALVDSTQDLGAAIDAKQSTKTLSVTTGSDFHVGEILVVGSEKMLLEDITGNSLIVSRAYDGSPLAAHLLGDGVFVYRSYTVQRGALGTTAASHSDADTVQLFEYPGGVVSLALAYAQRQLRGEGTAYSGNTTDGRVKIYDSAAIQALEESAIQRYGRLRVGAV